MNVNPETATSTGSANHCSPTDERKQSPPAFLDLANSRVELKRLEHERQRILHRKLFEDQMRALEKQQAQELLNIPFDPSASTANGSIQHLAVSAPTTPPRVDAVLSLDIPTGTRPRIQHSVDPDSYYGAAGTATSDKRKSVTYAPSVNLSPELQTSVGHSSQSFARPVVAKSMPASRRASASSQDEELAMHLQSLALAGEQRTRTSPAPGLISPSILTRNNSRYGDDPGAHYASAYHAGMLLDEQLDQEMHNAMRNLPTSDNDKFHSVFSPKVTTSSAALDLALISQSRSPETRDKPSEWLQFPSRRAEGNAARSERRIVTNPNLTLSTRSEEHSVGRLAPIPASAAPLVQQFSQGSSHSYMPSPASRRGSPSMLDGIAARSVPGTPHGSGVANTPLHVKTPRTPSDSQPMNARLSPLESTNGKDLQSSLSRMPSSHYDTAHAFKSMSSTGLNEQYDMDYTLNGGLDSNRYNGYSPNPSVLPNATTGSTALYHHNGSRYGFGLASRGNGPQNEKMAGLHGTKHKRGDMDFNRFAGTRLEDLQGEISTLCKDQHGCRYLQKKLEEGNPEHRDMIFRETFGHFAELMIDPFGNYLCQKLLEYSTDEQRNVICESVAKDLVNISLNMHGTRAVQKMIDFLSSRRQQTDLRFNAQIHSIIVALSLHVVVLIKDLNGNHVIQKCLNKLAPDDNQFIYNAVAANCVEVATHRHGCCVLQRCIDHASDHQRVQLVNEITYNALTLVQDPYGNYVVQYILDLNDNRFSDAVIRQFTGNVCALSVQKFSSNVIEKCIRVAEHSTRKMLIEELLNRSRLEKLLRDSYGNYCVQTALDYAEHGQRALLVEGIRPILPLIRNTPYGKRIQNKLQREQMDHFTGGNNGYRGALNPISLGGRIASTHGGSPHVVQAHQLTDIYGGQNSLFPIPQGQASFGPNHLTTARLHGLPAQAIDGYVLQGNSAHNQSISTNHPLGGGFSGTSFGFPGHGAVSDLYQRSNFGYGM